MVSERKFSLKNKNEKFDVQFGNRVTHIEHKRSYPHIHRSDIDGGKVLCALIVIGMVGGSIFFGYWWWYDSNTTDVQDKGHATRMFTDMWGRWVELDNDPARTYHVNNDAWTTIRIGDMVTVYRLFVTWEIFIEHRIAITAS